MTALVQNRLGAYIQEHLMDFDKMAKKYTIQQRCTFWVKQQKVKRTPIKLKKRKSGHNPETRIKVTHLSADVAERAVIHIAIHIA